MAENSDNKTDKVPTKKLLKTPEEFDDFGAVMIYGNFKIRDLDTGETLINKRF